MRVSNKANQNFGQSSQGSRERQQAFKQRKQLGQAVLGTVIQELKSGLAWVNVDGLRLLAELPFAVAKGQTLLLRIEQLEPEIVLKFSRSLHAGPNNQMGLYANLRNKIELGWQDFLNDRFKATPGSAGTPLTGSVPEASFVELPPLALGEPFPAAWLQAGCQVTAALQKLFQEFLMQNRPHAQLQSPPFSFQNTSEANAENGFEPDPKTGPETDFEDTFATTPFSEGEKTLSSLQKETVTSLGDLGAEVWQHVPWHSPHGWQQELLVLQQPKQKIKQLFLSGLWPKAGSALIAGLILQEQASLRVYTQSPLSLPEAAALLNLAGLPQTLAFARQQFNLPHSALTNLTCLELKIKSSDTASGILLKLSQAAPFL